MIHRTWLVLGLLPALALATCDGQDEGATAQEMANRLTDALDFDDDTPREGDPPPEHPGDAAFPQVTDLDAPSTLAPGEPFAVDLSTDFAEPGQIAGAVAHVDSATRYLEIASTYDPGLGLVRLTGRLREDSSLGGRSFQVRFALLDAAGEVGNYRPWSLEVELPAGDADVDSDVDTDPGFNCPGGEAWSCQPSPEEAEACNADFDCCGFPIPTGSATAETVPQGGCIAYWEVDEYEVRVECQGLESPEATCQCSCNALGGE